MPDTSLLIDSGIADLKAATITYAQYVKNLQAGKYPDPLATKWGSGLDKLTRASALEHGETTTPSDPGAWTIEPPRTPTYTVANVPGLGINVTTQRAITDYVIDTTGDTGVLFQLAAGGSSLQRVQMRNIAKLNTVTYGKHAVYGKAANLLLEDIDADCSPYCASCFSLRYDGAILRRFRANGAPHAITYYETSSNPGQVLIEHGTGTFTNADTGIWMDAETFYQQVIRQAFTIRDVHLAGPGRFFLKAYIYRFTGLLNVQGCTLNGQPVTTSMIAGVPSSQLTVTP